MRNISIIVVIYFNLQTSVVLHAEFYTCCRLPDGRCQRLPNQVAPSAQPEGGAVVPRMVILKLTSHVTKWLTSPPVACATYFASICTHDYATTDRNKKDGPAPKRVQQQTSIQPGQEVAPTSGTAATAPSVPAPTTDAIPHRDPLGTGQGPP